MSILQLDIAQSTQKATALITGNRRPLLGMVKTSRFPFLQYPLSGLTRNRRMVQRGKAHQPPFHPAAGAEGQSLHPGWAWLQLRPTTCAGQNG